MRAPQGFFARLLNDVNAGPRNKRNRTGYQRRFEGLEVRQVLSANGLCADLDGEPDRPIEAEVAGPVTDELTCTKYEDKLASNSTGDPLVPNGEATVWDDTDIVHFDGDRKHDQALEDFDFAEVLASVSPELLEAVASADVASSDSGCNGFFDVFTELTSKNDFFDVWTELQAAGQGNGFEEIEVTIDDQSNGAIFVKIPGLSATNSIIDIGDLPDGFTAGSIIDIGDLPDGLTAGSIIDVGDLPDGFTAGSIIDVGDLPDGLTSGSIIDVGDLPDGLTSGSIIDVGDLPGGFTAGSIIDVGDLPDGLTNSFEEFKVTVGDQSNGAIFVKIPGLMS